MTNEIILEDEFLDDVEPYEGTPDYLSPQGINYDGVQDDDAGVIPLDVASFVGRVSLSATNGWRDTLKWYRENNIESEIGFDPDGMCLKVCRTARNIPARYTSAKEAQDATPAEHRVHQIRDLRRGMVLYFDEPNDSNRFGHIVTLVGRRPGYNPNSLSDLLVVTNSVKVDELVVVRGDYFETHWGDQFAFGATWLNGVVLDVPEDKLNKIEKFSNGGPVYDLNILARSKRQVALKTLRSIEANVKRLPDSPKQVRVREFKEEWRVDRKIDLRILDAAVENGRVGVVRRVRDEIKRLIKALPDE